MFSGELIVTLTNDELCSIHLHVRRHWHFNKILGKSPLPVHCRIAG